MRRLLFWLLVVSPAFAQTGPGFTYNLDCSQSKYAGADPSLTIQNCLQALKSINSAAGVADASNVPVGTAWSINPFSSSASSDTFTAIPNAGRLKLPLGWSTINVPIVIPENWNVSCTDTDLRSVGPGAGTLGCGLQASSSNFVGTYSTGTISVGTTGQGEVIAGSGTSWTNSLVGCAFVAPSTQPTAANSTYGIISGITSSTSLTLGFGQNNGTGAGSGSSYAIECPILQMDDANNSSGDTPGIGIDGVGVDCNNVAGCIGIQNWSAQEFSHAHRFAIRQITNIGLDVETGGAQNGGDYTEFTISPGSSATAATIPFVLRPGIVPVRKVDGFTIGNGSFAGAINNGIDIEAGMGSIIMDGHFEGATVGAHIGGNISCPIVCAIPPRFVAGLKMMNIDGGGSTTGLTAVVEVDNSFSTNQSIQLEDVTIATSAFADSIKDLQNSCTSAAGRFGTYILDASGNISYSTDKTAGCFPTVGGPALWGEMVGSITSSSSGNIFPFPFNSTGSVSCSTQSNCGTAIGNGGLNLSHNCTLHDLSARVGTAGVSGDALTVVNNGTNTSISVPLTSTGALSDTTHTSAYTAGGTLRVVIAVGRSDTLANVTFTLRCD